MKLDLSKTAYLEVVLDEAEVRIEVYQAFDLLCGWEGEKKYDHFIPWLNTTYGLSVTYEQAVEVNNAIIETYKQVSEERKKKRSEYLASRISTDSTRRNGTNRKSKSGKKTSKRATQKRS